MRARALRGVRAIVGGGAALGRFGRRQSVYEGPAVVRAAFAELDASLLEVYDAVQFGVAFFLVGVMKKLHAEGAL